MFVEFRMFPHVSNNKYLFYWIDFLTFLSTMALSEDFDTNLKKRCIDDIFALKGNYAAYKSLWKYLKTIVDIGIEEFYDIEKKYKDFNPKYIHLMIIQFISR